MKILVLGSGLMGPAAAFNAMCDPDVAQVIICDIAQAQLQKSIKQLAGKAGAQKLGVVRLDLNNLTAAVELMANFDAIVAALPRPISAQAIRAALQANTPIVDLALLSDDDLAALEPLAQATKSLAILGCGVEPGLTEIIARHLAEQLDQVDELHIKCGGIPVEPKPPLGYKIVFGGRQLPLRESEARLVEDGQLKPVARYSGVEPVTFSGVGLCEAWHEGFMPWLLEIPALQELRLGTQKTIRWPGYAAKVTVLKEMGLLNSRPVQVDDVEVSPKALLDALLYPKVKLDDDEQDMTLLRVEAVGRKENQPCRLQAEMVDRYDEALGFTSMARTTAFTGAIVARMIARKDLSGKGLLHPEQIITGSQVDLLLQALAAANINFEFTTTA